MPCTRTPTARRVRRLARGGDADQRGDLLARQPAARRRAGRRLDRLDAHLRAQRALAAHHLARDRARELLDVQRLADHEALDRLADLLGEARHVHALVRRVEIDGALEPGRVETLLAAVRDADHALDARHPRAREREVHARRRSLHVVPQHGVVAGGPAHAPDRTRARGLLASITLARRARRTQRSSEPRRRRLSRPPDAAGRGVWLRAHDRAHGRRHGRQRHVPAAGDRGHRGARAADQGALGGRALGARHAAAAPRAGRPRRAHAAGSRAQRPHAGARRAAPASSRPTPGAR